MKVFICSVTNDNDPEKRGRIKVGNSEILGDDAGNPEEIPDWIEPCFPFVGKDSSGWFSVPSVGTQVEVEAHTPDHSLIEQPYYRYRACLYQKKSSIPEEFQTNYPYRMGIKFPSGHLLLFDNKKDAERIELKHKDGLEIVITKDILYVGAESGVDQAVLFSTLKTAFDNHTHLTAWGTSSPPTSSSGPLPSNVGSSSVKIKT